MHKSVFDFDQFLTEIRSSRKYRGLDLPESTLRDLVERESLLSRSAKEIEQAVREKLHNIVAPYLGDPDYARDSLAMQATFSHADPAAIQEFCLQILSSHASTRERIPLLADFYTQIWQITGRPAVLLDLACGLHPFGLPWMQLSAETSYFAFDLHHPRVELIRNFFTIYGQAGAAIHQDILVRPPELEADVAFFFKEAHRFEQRQKGCNRAFWQALKVRWLLVSLPVANLTGRHDLLEKQRKLVYSTLEGLDWPVQELQIGNEMVFCIRKHEVVNARTLPPQRHPSTPRQPPWSVSALLFRPKTSSTCWQNWTNHSRALSALTR